MIKQIINGKTVGTVYANVSSADFTTISAVLAGKSENYTKVAEGGTPFSVTTPNAVKFSVGKVTLEGRISTAVSIPHLKVGKKDSDIRTVALGAFDVAYDIGTKCEYVNLIGNSSRG